MNNSISEYFREHGDVTVRSIGYLFSDDNIEQIISAYTEYVIDTIPEEPDVRDSLQGRCGFLADAYRERLPWLAMVEATLVAAQNYSVIGQLTSTNPDALDMRY